MVDFQGPDLKKAAQRKHNTTKKETFFLNDEDQHLGDGKKYFIQTYGCQANERDSESLSGMLEGLGFSKADNIENTDVLILNTCAIRDNAEQKVFGKIGNIKGLKENHPDLLFGICGCMAQEENVVNRIMEKYHHVDFVFGTHNLHRLPAILKSAMYSKKTVVEVWSEEGRVVENIPAVRNARYKAWVDIMYGCDKFCTYCIVPYTRGKERSRDLKDIIREVSDLKASGYQEVTLLGQNVNAYGKDLGLDFASLLSAVADTGIPRIRFVTSHPWDFNRDMIDVIAKYDNIMPYIHLPIQSGDDEILKRMNRKYTVSSYLSLFDDIKARIPGCAISTDIIVGFPNESDIQFEHTLDIVRRCQFDNAYTFVFSPRQGTPAAKMPDEIPLPVKEERLQRLNELVNYYALEKMKPYEGKVEMVLAEGFSKKDPHKLTGYTPTQKLVNFTGDPALVGQIVPVKITAARTWSLAGEAL